MKHLILTITFLLISGLAICQEHHSSDDIKKAELIYGLGDHHHPVSTKNAEAQRFFNQGLTFIYAFNHDEAIRSFKRAAELDRNLAMVYWGIAYALGPNINLPVDLERENAAYEAVQKAVVLSKKAPKHERAYIEALAKRYSNNPKADLYKLAVDFKNAMGELSKRYPDDLDAATLYAESAMNLRPWQLWNKDGTPAEGTEEVVSVLESVLKRDPNHIGANHYYIHAIEASRNPERALPSAERLKTLVPSAGHLVHMQAHIYARTGDYEASAKANEAGAKADEEYIRTTGGKGVYPIMYYNHNLQFLAVAYSMEGRFQDAINAARKLEANAEPIIKEMPMVEFVMPTSTLILVRFNRWDDILKSPQPDQSMLMTTAIWHFARGMAYVNKGEIKKAENEQSLFVSIKNSIPAETMWDLNRASDVMGIAGNVLGAKIAIAEGDKKSAVELLRKAVEAEDALNYAEPAGWYIPVRESLGRVLMMSGDYAEAERVFRADLERNPRSGRSLFGLAESLKAQGKTYDAQMVRREFELAWRNADIKLRLEDL